MRASATTSTGPDAHRRPVTSRRPCRPRHSQRSWTDHGGTLTTKNTFLTPDSYRTGQPDQNLGLTTDPLTRNTYTYVNGDPVNLVDPSGHDPACRGLNVREGCKTVVYDANSGGKRGLVLTFNKYGVVTNAQSGVLGAGPRRQASDTAQWRRRYGSARDKALQRHLDLCRGSDADCSVAAYYQGGGTDSAEAQSIYRAVCDTERDGGRGCDLGEARADQVTQEIVTSILTAGAGFAARRGLGLAGALRSTSRGSFGDELAPRSTSLVDDGLALCRSNSFMPTTLVLMADGTAKQIADIEVGDMVMATDPETDERGARRVTDTIVGEGIKDLVDIEIDGDVITATSRHPFWVDDDGRWVNAEDLEAGDVLLLAAGTTVPVDSIRERTEVRRVHNLAVDGIHTYFVVAGNDPVLVHNCTPLTRAEQRLLGGLADDADAMAFDVLRQRGGGAVNVRGAGLQDNMGQWSLRELAHAARQGDRQAERWIKMIKQAGSQGKGGS